MRRAALFALIVSLALTAWLAPRAARLRAATPEQPVGSSTETPSATTRPATLATTRARLADHVVVISVDGLRPDMLLRCNTPHMHELFREGSFTFWAKTTVASITLPSHISMLTGVSPRKHGIDWNRDLPLSRPVFPAYPTLFAVAHKAGYTTAMVAGKSKFDFLEVPGTIDYAVVPKKTGKDRDVAAEAAKLIRERRPQVLFVHLPGTDVAGHDKGWGTPEQVKAVEEADKAVGTVLYALDEADVRDRTLIILSADHGGAGKTHGPEDTRSRSIPWIASGPGVRKGLDLTVYADLDVHTEDTFATACYFLAIPLGKGLDGKPVLEILQNRGELMHDTTDATGAADGRMPTTAPTTTPADLPGH